MSIICNVEPKSVFKYFEEICLIPHGSENMSKIADYCVNFAKNHSLRFVRDKADNVIIYKKATRGYEKIAPIILQGHLDMVCQKASNCDIDFLEDGLSIYKDGDFIKARGTTLGADNGIAVAMILSILASDDICHPAIEAVFTTDEEIGMIGACKLDYSNLSAKRMINLDAESDSTLTVSCAGGSDFKITIPFILVNKSGTALNIVFKGFKGGHSGVEIGSGRENSNIIAGRFLDYIKEHCDFDIVSIDGGNKGNAIPSDTVIKILVKNKDEFVSTARRCINNIKEEIGINEPGFEADIEVLDDIECKVLSKEIKNKLIYALAYVPNGVIKMSDEIEGLVETSLNLGILKTNEDNMFLHFTLRSNKKSELAFLEEKLKKFCLQIQCLFETSGHYPPWEFNDNSYMQALYKDIYAEKVGTVPSVEAIHAGLECGLFSDRIDDLDCIAIGPNLFDVHTINERLSTSSTAFVYDILIELLKRCS